MSLLIQSEGFDLPLRRACDALALNRSTLYWRLSREELSEEQKERNRVRKHCAQSRELSADERDGMHALLNSDEFVDQSPVEIYHTLLERGEDPCSISTMHSILRENQQNGERRQHRPAKHHAIPRLLAIKPNQVWTWDCSKFPTLSPGIYLTLYVVLDLFSCFVVAWMVSRKENSALAQQLMDQGTHRYSMAPNQLKIHQNRGSPMVAHRYIDLMGELGVTLSYSRPRASNDNAFSEAKFKTLKYQPDYPERFCHAAHATDWCTEYFDWYNFAHHHSRLNCYTPEQYSLIDITRSQRLNQAALDHRYSPNPERFVNGKPTITMLPSQILINPVTSEEIA